MKKLIPLLCGLVLLSMILPSTFAVAKSNYQFQNAEVVSTWLWDTAKIVSDKDRIVNNLVDRHVNQLLLQIDPTLDVKYYKAFISKAAAKGISVHALDGAPQWVDKTGTELQGAFLTWLENYQKVAVPSERFRGIHLDVEPYGHDEYEGSENEFITRYQLMMMDFTAQANRLDLEFGIDIPFWFYGVQYDNKYGKGNVAEWLCQNVKAITIMAYRDVAGGTDGIINIAAKEMKLFEKYKVKGTIAVETGRLSEQYKFVTFYEETQAYMYQQLDMVYQSYKGNSAFNGIAIHHYDSWINMK